MERREKVKESGKYFFKQRRGKSVEERDVKEGRGEQIQLPAKLLDYFLRSTKRNINRSR